jgi:hypothetical protein
MIGIAIVEPLEQSSLQGIIFYLTLIAYKLTCWFTAEQKAKLVERKKCSLQSKNDLENKE